MLKGWRKKQLKKKFKTTFPLSTLTWKKAFIEYGFPLLAAISTETNWGIKCACGQTMRKTHYELNPGYKTWKKWFLGKDIHPLRIKFTLNSDLLRLF